MANAAREHKRDKSKKQEYVSPRKPFKKRKNVPLAAVVTAAILAAPVTAKAGEVSTPGSHKPSISEKAYRNNGVSIPLPDFDQSIEGEYPFEGGKAKIRYVGAELETMSGVYEITFHLDGRRFSPPTRFTAPLPGNLGDAYGVFVSERKTVIITENHMVVMQGYRDLLDGSRVGDHSSHRALPEGLRGNVVSVAAEDTGSLGTVFVLSQGSLWALRTDDMEANPISIGVSASAGAVLKSYGGRAVVIQPSSGENFVKVFSPDFASGELKEECTRGSDVTFSSGAGVNEVPGGFSVSSGDSTVYVLFETGGEVTVASSLPSV
ncbi:MAG: hypothetical protein WC350_02155 [Candidatus Micrarchaeia archaeon]|jgi:hypothetical protein